VARRGTALHGVARCCASIRERRFEDEYGSEEEEQSKEYDQKPRWERKKKGCFLLSLLTITLPGLFKKPTHMFHANFYEG